MFCSNCGHQLPDGSGFCSNCGARLTGQAPTTATVSKTQMSNKEIYYIVLSVISFVLAVVFLGIFVDNLKWVVGNRLPDELKAYGICAIAGVVWGFIYLRKFLKARSKRL